MKTISEHIAYVKGKPHQMRKQIAFGTAMFASAFIALVWLVGSALTGVFALQGGSFAMNTEQASIATTSASGDAGIAGAAAAVQDASAPAHIEIVDTTPAPAKKQSDPTIVPF